MMLLFLSNSKTLDLQKISTHTMIYITQLVYIKPGQEKAFDEFESVAIPIIARYNGELQLRLRPDKDALLAGTIPPPYEVHLVSFATDDDFENFKQDEERKKYLHLKEQSILSVVLIKGIQPGELSNQ